MEQSPQTNNNIKGPQTVSSLQSQLSLAKASFSSEIVAKARADLSARQEPTSDMAQWRPCVDYHIPRKDRLIISIAIGAQAEELLKFTGPPMERYAKRCGAQFAVLTKQTQTWWGLEKFRVGQFAQKHQQTLFLDADVFIRSTAPNLFDLIPAKHVAMCLELKALAVMALKKPVITWSRAMYSSQGETARRYRGLNSGVVFCDSTTAGVWTPPTQAFKPFHTSEQAWVERNVEAFKLPFHRLHWRFNCQHWPPNFEERVGRGHFIHLSGASHEKRLVLCEKLIAGKI